MSDVRRYTFDEGFADPADDGDYVLASDYDALSARCDELERRLAGAWVVMELEWREIGKSLFRANTPLGPVIINFCRDGWFVDSNDSGITATYPSLAAAKAAAQQWYESRLTAGLRRAGEQLTLTKESLR